MCLYIWLGVTALSLMIEFTTNEMLSIWFAGGGVLAMILSACGLSWYIHVPVFLAMSLVLLFSFRKTAMKLLNKGDEKTNADSAFGKEYTLLTEIAFEKMGTIKINGVIWNVVGDDPNCEIKAGEKVKVLKLQGNKYVVEKLEK